MLSITEFSRLSGLSVKTLRYYHAEGVLVPSHVDERTQYRWYRVGQVAGAAQISAMRRAGMSLAEVRRLVEDVDLVPGALKRHRERIDLERMDQDAAVAELDDSTAERYLPTVRQRSTSTSLTTTGAWRHGHEEDAPDTEWEHEAVSLRQDLTAIAAERGFTPTEEWWTALEVRGDAAAQRVGQPLIEAAASDCAGADLPARFSFSHDEPAEEVVVGLRPGAARAAARQAMITVLSFAADGLIADPRTLRFVDQGGEGAEFTALLVTDPSHRAQSEENP